MRTKIILLSTTVLVSAGVTMHHFRYCPLQHMKAALAHHKMVPPAKDVKATNNTAVLAMNK
jgi:hypothetical protein